MADAALSQDHSDITLTPILGYEPQADEVDSLVQLAFDHKLASAATPAGASLDMHLAFGHLDAPSAYRLLGDAAREAGAARRTLEWTSTRFSPDHVVEFSAIRPNGGRISVFGRLGVPEEAERLEQFVAGHWARSNLYYGVNPRSDSLLTSTSAAPGSQVASTHTVFFDHDDGPADAAGRLEWERRIVALHGADRIDAAVRSGNGLHIYIDVVEERDPQALNQRQGLLKNWIGLVGADPSASDLARILRLPYTINIPNQSKLKKGRRLGLATVITDPCHV